MTQELNNKIKQIKQTFHLFMDGVASHSMRQKGSDYKVNWGIPITRLKEIAKEYGKDMSLAIALWKENTRECKILATYIMPAEEVDNDLVEIWMSEVKTQELAELLAFNLLRHTTIAPTLAFRMIATDNDYQQICGYQLLACLFADRKELNERAINEFFDQAKTALESSNITIKHAAYNAIIKFCNLGDDFEKLAMQAFAAFDIL
ncbi:MAG: DNA alkylation repair protein [Prevotella sp.]|nr:DNA alkylation repair protein [Prevotellaceae bacterium]MDY3936202.1 DNA alkylation repair protein [Prevotella sp.]